MIKKLKSNKLKTGLKYINIPNPEGFINLQGLRKKDTMQRYIEQLIDDLHKATWGMKPPHELWEESGADPDNELELEDMSYIEKYIYGEEQPVSVITGIECSQLPPTDKLSEEQQSLLAVELEKLLQYFHFYLDFPENFPAHLRYPFILDFWKEEHVALSFGEDHIEFCDYSEGYCAFPEYCTSCPEIEAQMEFDKQFENKDSSGPEFDVTSLLPTPSEIEAWVKNQEIDDDERELDDIFGVSENNDPAPDFTGGFFNDDGTPIDPESVPVPSLCIVCKSYYIDDPEEKFLCMMNRNDQRDDPDFICGAFEKI